MSKEKTFQFQQELPQVIVSNGKNHLTSTFSVEILADLEFVRQDALEYLHQLLWVQQIVHQYAGNQSEGFYERMNTLQKIFADMLKQEQNGEIATPSII